MLLRRLLVAVAVGGALVVGFVLARGLASRPTEQVPVIQLDRDVPSSPPTPVPTTTPPPRVTDPVRSVATPVSPPATTPPVDAPAATQPSRPSLNEPPATVPPDDDARDDDEEADDD